jgi:MoxR-like ATPase
MPFKKATNTCQSIATNIEKVIKGQSASIRLLLAAFGAGGHVLLEDFPGTGKTTLAKALAQSVDADFKRIQFTPDLLPSDILGLSVFDQRDQTFHFHEGPIFCHILLADEINRASPRTQSALLEAMAEAQVSIDGKRYVLQDPFFVIATQNPVESHGAYPLPEAQMDRFALRFSLGYVAKEEEIAMLIAQNTKHPINTVTSCVSLADVLQLRSTVSEVRISDEIRRYIVEIVSATRSKPGVQLGASPRASIALARVAQALALFDGMEIVTPDHVQGLAEPIIAHRITLDPEAKFSGTSSRNIVAEIIESIRTPH